MNIKAVIICIMLIIIPLQYSLADGPVFVYNLLDAIALSENTQKPIFCVFTADWCSVCQVMKKDIENNQSIFDNYIVCYVDYDKNKDLIKEYKVSIIPDYIVIRNKIEQKRKQKYENIKKLKEWLSSNE